MKNGKQQMFDIYDLFALPARFQNRQLQNIVGFLVKCQVFGIDGLVKLVSPDSLFQLVLHGLSVDVQPGKEIHNHVVMTAENAKQQMFRPHGKAG